ncbi:regulatory protein RecX [Nakamurella endophytica]|uniref:Regulatory protein RecX n=1 Tax=Nakamurella endophytica TaxID=1748367 RepID=A0A917T7B8_9ACTN|nr:regulatory protein RecX [Nakamurella endophytica]GGM13089.1 hypothetical protein GCM10011594_36250 [Nakamurella endophytica]
MPDDAERGARVAALQDRLAELTARQSTAPAPVPTPAGGRSRRGSSDGDSAQGRGSGRPDRDDDTRRAESAALDYCLRVLAVSPRTQAQLEQRLARREVPAEVARTVIERLHGMRLIDDGAYAADYVRAKHRDRGLAGSALRRELRRQGVDPAVAAAAVGDQIDRGAERDRAEALVRARMTSALRAGPVAARRRLLAALDRRGYPAELAIAVVDEALGAVAVAGSGSGADPADDGPF